MLNIGPAELIVILLVALLIVGPKRLPEVGKSVGKALREIRRQTDEVRSSFEMDLDDHDDVEPIHDVTGAATTDLDAETGDEGWDASSWDAEEQPEEATPTAAEEPPVAVEAEAPPARRRRRKAAGPAEPGDQQAAAGATDAAGGTDAS